MKIYTTNFANVKNLDEDVVPVAICAKPPRGWDGLHFRALAPSYDLYVEWKAIHNESSYRRRYYEETLSHLTPGWVIEALTGMTRGADKVALVCYEKPGEWCHRTLVAEWLTNAGYPVKEFELSVTPKKKQGDHADNHNKAYINDKGEQVIRVTEVIKILGKDQIAIWANMLGFKGIDYRKELERAANIGTMFHAIVEQYTTPHRLALVDYEEYGVYGLQSRREASNAIESFFKWFDNLSVKYNVKFTEKVIVGERMGGTIDCGIDGFKDPDKVIFVDYKTSGNFYFTHFLQLSGYVDLYEEKYGKDTVEGIMVVRVDKKHGDPAECHYISRDKLDPFILCFRSLLETALMTRMLEATWYDLGKNIK